MHLLLRASNLKQFASRMAEVVWLEMQETMHTKTKIHEKIEKTQSERMLTRVGQKNLLICVIFFAKFLAFLAGITV